VFALASLAAAGDTLVLKAGKVYLGDGTVLEGGAVVVADGRIAAIGPNLPIPEGARVLEAPDGCVTPGLIDANSTVGIAEPSSWAEHASEVIPYLHTLDAVDLTDEGFARVARQGVTTVYLGGDPASVIGSTGVVVKTGGGAPWNRVVLDGVHIKLTIGNEPSMRGTYNRLPRGGRSDFLTRRPATRMGVAFVFRMAMFDALPYAAEGTPEDPATRELVRVLRGELPLRVQARSVHDILTAFRLTREFGIERFILEEGIEAARCLDELRAARIPVIYGPIEATPTGYRGREIERPNLSTPHLLQEAGVPLALSAGDLPDEAALPWQGFLAVRYGLARDEAVKATTSTPARLLGLEDRIGTLAVGRDADVVLWSGEIFEPTTRAEVVVIGGEIVHDGTNR